MKAADPFRIERLIIEAMAADDWQRVAELGEILDQLATSPRRPSLAKSALWYVHHGFRVFPLQPRSKLPYKGSRGFEDATTSEVVIAAWWQRWPRANIGLATGHLVDVIDIDKTEGVKSWLASKLPKPDEPEWASVLGVVWTPRAKQPENHEFAKGGMHLYVTARGGGNRSGIMPGIDYRGLGGYVLAPPSVNVEGEPYRWRSALRLPTSERPSNE